MAKILGCLIQVLHPEGWSNATYISTVCMHSTCRGLHASSDLTLIGACTTWYIDVDVGVSW